MTEREALKLALEALDGWGKGFPDNWGDLDTEAVNAIKEALAQPEQEPVAWISENSGLYHGKPNESLNPLPLYLSPSEGDIRAFKHRMHELEGELLGYKKIVADQDALLLRNAERIVDLQTHIANLEGEE